ncbi:hypothetical protein PU629_04040 [Pullulanibacillus sp. KACC 23026]|uniref:hypothetical protein n=1 Tax=Pullulanibacillus sp. KACC 23026 TaxID=3028315 RepID=UPI0023AEA326|nr:hypothetical protein [Pullulanibacillus sp. KACC 23026]WEG13546.1 hypothetical protein PU629_04040 [Pullulanibacillus sp. KACC 23026]
MTVDFNFFFQKVYFFSPHLFLKEHPEEIRFTAMFDHAYHNAIPSPDLQNKYGSSPFSV